MVKQVHARAFSPRLPIARVRECDYGSGAVVFE